VAVTYDGERLRAFINCKPAAEADTPAPIMSGTRPFFIGNYIGRKNAYAFEGAIDEVRVYDEALTEEQIFSAAVEGMP
jgi:hypothetical protein